MSDDDYEYQRYREAKHCFVPICTNNDVKNPDIRFFGIRKDLKEDWCLLLGRNCPKRTLFCCEEHINFKEDFENYEKWMSGAKPRLKRNAILKNYSNETTLKIMKDIPSAATSSAVDTVHIKTPRKVHSAVPRERGVAKKTITVKLETEDMCTDFQAHEKKERVVPSQISHLPVSRGSCQTASLIESSNFESTSSASVKDDDDKVKHGREIRECLLQMIKNKPETYLGVPKKQWWLIKFIAQQYSCLELHIIITLFKLKNNDSIVRMSDEFQMATSTIKVIFEKHILILATFFQNFIYFPPVIKVKKHLPLVFRTRYSHFQCLINCFEIQIDKPSDPMRQAQTWSPYKSSHTIKYLIGCTPAGFISFVSEGYGGRISNKAIIEKTGFIDSLPLNAVIMADKGFDEIKTLLSTKNIKFIRAPSPFVNKKMTEKEDILTRANASLKVHIDCVIRRVGEFGMLKPYSVENNNHLKYLNQLIVVACGLINLQEPKDKKRQE